MACNNPQAMAELSQAARCVDKLYLLQERAIPALVDIIRAPDTNSPVLVEVPWMCWLPCCGPQRLSRLLKCILQPLPMS